MRKEGTGKPQNPDIALDADVKMRELYFKKVPNPEVRFRGSTRRNSVWGTRRENLPNTVQEGVAYRDAGIRLRVATEMVHGDPDPQNSSDKERVKVHPEGSTRTPGEQQPESREGKE